MGTENASVLITGCSAGGIGSALVESFQKRGLHVFASARSLIKMSHLVSLPNVTLLILDVTSASSIAEAFTLVKEKTNGRLDYLINNSGVQYMCPTLDVNIVDAKAMFDVNFWAVLAVTQAFSPLIFAAKGSIVNIGSISGILYAPWMGVYGASKAALLMLDETMRLEVAPFGVKVLTIITGAVETNIMANSPEVKMPPDSKYTEVAGIIKAKAEKQDVPGPLMKTHDYAEKVIGDILGGASGKVWRGGMATMVRCSAAFLPSSIMDSTLANGSGLDNLV